MGEVLSGFLILIFFTVMPTLFSNKVKQTNKKTIIRPINAVFVSWIIYLLRIQKHCEISYQALLPRHIFSLPSFSQEHETFYMQYIQ